MRTNVHLEAGKEYQLFTRYGIRRGVYDRGWGWFHLTDCAHPAENSVMHSDNVYFVTVPPASEQA